MNLVFALKVSSNWKSTFELKIILGINQDVKKYLSAIQIIRDTLGGGHSG